ncbi:MAG: cupredoxin domain-containing protein [Gaiellaceae bacterium]
MRKVILVLAAVLTLTVAGPAGAATTKTINIYGSGFAPKSATITEGDTVTWVNKDNANHQILADKGQFVSPILRPGQKYSFSFNAAGTYTYKDELNRKLAGTITVKGLPPTLTLAASSQYVVYGDKVTLSGVVSNHKGGEQVTIYYQPYPQPNPISRATLLTAADGSFSFIVSPRIATSYQATWKGAYATPTSIQVQPKLTLGRNNGWIIHAAAGVSFSGKAVQLQRLNTLTGQWVTLKKVILNSKSAAKVLYKLPKGQNQLRVTMSVNQAGAGFLGAISPIVKWHQLT